MQENINKLYDLVVCGVGSVDSLNVNTSEFEFSPLGMSRMKNLIVSALKLYYMDCLCGMDENILNFALFLLFTVCVEFLTVYQS